MDRPHSPTAAGKQSVSAWFIVVHCASAEARTLGDLQGVVAESISKGDVAPGVVTVFRGAAAIEEDVLVRDQVLRGCMLGRLEMAVFWLCDVWMGNLNSISSVGNDELL